MLYLPVLLFVLLCGQCYRIEEEEVVTVNDMNPQSAHVNIQIIMLYAPQYESASSSIVCCVHW